MEFEARIDEITQNLIERLLMLVALPVHFHSLLQRLIRSVSNGVVDLRSIVAVDVLLDRVDRRLT